MRWASRHTRRWVQYQRNTNRHRRHSTRFPCSYTYIKFTHYRSFAFQYFVLNFFFHFSMSLNWIIYYNALGDLGKFTMRPFRCVLTGSSHLSLKMIIVIAAVWADSNSFYFVTAERISRIWCFIDSCTNSKFSVRRRRRGRRQIVHRRQLVEFKLKKGARTKKDIFCVQKHKKVKTFGGVTNNRGCCTVPYALNAFKYFNYIFMWHFVLFLQLMTALIVPQQNKICFRIEIKCLTQFMANIFFFTCEAIKEKHFKYAIFEIIY